MSSHFFQNHKVLMDQLKEYRSLVIIDAKLKFLDPKFKYFNDSSLYLEHIGDFRNKGVLYLTQVDPHQIETKVYARSEVIIKFNSDLSMCMLFKSRRIFFDDGIKRSPDTDPTEYLKHLVRPSLSETILILEEKDK